MTLYKLIQEGEKIPENAIFFHLGQTPMQSLHAGKEFDPKRFAAHFIPVEVPDENLAPAPQAEEIPLGPEDVPPQSCFRNTKDLPSVSLWNLAMVHKGGIALAIGVEWTFKKLLDSGMEISRDFGKTWHPCRKVSKAAEPVWHNPDNVPIGKIPKGWRFAILEELELVKEKRFWNDGKWQTDDGCAVPGWTYIVPADTPLPTEA